MYRFGLIDGWPGSYWILYVKDKYKITENEPFGTFKNKKTFDAFIDVETRDILKLDRIIFRSKSRVSRITRDRFENEVGIIRALLYCIG